MESLRAARIGTAELQSLTFPLLAYRGNNGHFTVVQSFKEVVVLPAKISTQRLALS